MTDHHRHYWATGPLLLLTVRYYQSPRSALSRSVVYTHIHPIVYPHPPSTLVLPSLFSSNIFHHSYISIDHTTTTTVSTTHPLPPPR
jgi:hypothetical protein